MVVPNIIHPSSPLDPFPQQPHPQTAFLSPCPLPRHTQTPSQSTHLPHLCTIISPSRKPKSVGIAGAGIAGLTAALALLKTSTTGVEQVTLFEPRDAPDLGLGGALNINGGAAILSKSFGVDIHSIGRPLDSVIARDTTGSLLFHVDVEKQLASNPTARTALTQDGRHFFLSVMRDKLQQLLEEEVNKLGVSICRGSSNKVLGVLHQQNKACFQFANGLQSQYFDLLLGADGLRSNVRSYIAPQANPPRYSGIRVQWAIAPQGRCDLPPGRVEQWFGDGGYVLRYGAGPLDDVRELLAFAFREEESAAENAEYKTELGIRERFESRLVACGMPMQVMNVFERSSRFIETGVYYHSNLSQWSRGGHCVLIGDAVHAMPPFLGQGANQAIQDAYALAISLAGIGTSFKDLSEALQAFEAVRKVPTNAILQTSRVAGFLETRGGFVGMAARNNLFRILGVTGIVGQTFIQSATPRVPMLPG